MTTRHLIFALCLLCACKEAPQTKPISLHPDNPHYFLYKGKTAVLVTSAEHYGAVVNLDFDYIPYLNTLAEDSLNLTRVFAGPYVEPPGAFNIAENTLAPAKERFISPWARSETPGYTNGGNKFDLTRWDDQYFSRLKDFVSEAEKRDIIVELTFFCPFYDSAQWMLSPMNPVNNINAKGPQRRSQVYTLDQSNGLLEVQKELVLKIVRELKDQPNLIYEICNEPYAGRVELAWQHYIADIILEEEETYSAPHLISQNIANESGKITDPHAGVSVFNFHYAYPPIPVAQNYALNKVIGDNETGFDGHADSTYRREGWSFIFAGGALYNNLDYSFSPAHEDGTFEYPRRQPGGGSKSLRTQLSHLKRFANSFDLVRMRPDTTFIPPELKTAYALAEPGKQYGIYIFGKGPFHFNIAVPNGTYVVEYLNPVTGESQKEEPVNAQDSLRITSPVYPEDVAIRIMAQARDTR